MYGDIQSFEGTDSVDLVVSLHACDTATDYAIAKAVGWNASVILAVPCCQHEMNRQLKAGKTPMKAAFGYGVVKERAAALFTDAVRARALEQAGYDTQILEFIDMEHTPKNLLIRAVKSNRIQPGKAASAKEMREFVEFLDVQPLLIKLLEENGHL